MQNIILLVANEASWYLRIIY